MSGKVPSHPRKRRVSEVTEKAIAKCGPLRSRSSRTGCGISAIAKVNVTMGTCFGFRPDFSTTFLG
jgi:hypothetical protein